MDKLEKIIRVVYSTMAMEGFPVSREDKIWNRLYLENSDELDAMIHGLIEKHSVTKS